MAPLREPGQTVLDLGPYDESSDREVDTRTRAEFAMLGVVVHAFGQDAADAAGGIGTRMHFDPGASGQRERSDGFDRDIEVGEPDGTVVVEDVAGGRSSLVRVEESRADSETAEEVFDADSGTQTQFEVSIAEAGGGGSGAQIDMQLRRDAE